MDTSSKEHLDSIMHVPNTNSAINKLFADIEMAAESGLDVIIPGDAPISFGEMTFIPIGKTAFSTDVQATLCHYLRSHIHKSRKRLTRQGGSWRNKLSNRSAMCFSIGENNITDVRVNKIIDEPSGSILWKKSLK